MILNPSPISSVHLNYDREKKKFYGELSLLRKGLGRVYDDACDAGFTIVSKKTGKSAVFAIHREKRDKDNDLLYIEFVCVTPGLKDLTATLYND